MPDCLVRNVVLDLAIPCLLLLIVAQLVPGVSGVRYYGLEARNVNRNHSGWGYAVQPFLSIAGSTLNSSGKDASVVAGRPSGRDISRALLPSPHLKRLSNFNASVMLTSLGTFLLSDMVSFVEPVGAPDGVDGDDTAPIAVSQNDIGMDPQATGNKTIPFLRAPCTKNSKGERQPINGVSSWLDGSQIYGPNATLPARYKSRGEILESMALELMYFNLLGRVSPPSRNEDLRPVGDSAVRVNPLTLSLTRLMIREHNKIASSYRNTSRGLADEEVFQYARIRVVAQLQALMYYEFLPNLGITLPLYRPGDYRDDIMPYVDNFFAAVTSRFVHSTLTDVIPRLDHSGRELVGGSFMWTDVWQDPGAALLLVEDKNSSGSIDPILQGMIRKLAGAVEPRYCRSVQQELFSRPGTPGSDLLALDIQRGRDLGVPGYNRARLAFNLSRVENMADISTDMDVVRVLQEQYKNDLRQVDALVGALAEAPQGSGHLGPLLAASFISQMTRTRNGDWFYFENTRNGLFTTEEIEGIRGRGLKHLILDNTDIQDLPRNIYRVEDEVQHMPVMATCEANNRAAGPAGRTRWTPRVLTSTQPVRLLDGNYLVRHLSLEEDRGHPVLKVGVEVNTITGWIGFGVSQGHSSFMRASDFTIFFPNSRGRGEMKDFQGVGYCAPKEKAGTTTLLTDLSVGPDVTTLNFTYPLSEEVAERLDTQDVALLFAYHPFSNQLEYHGFDHRTYISMQSLMTRTYSSQNATTASEDEENHTPRHRQRRRVHGILMAVSFAFLYPLGSLVGRLTRSVSVVTHRHAELLLYAHVGVFMAAIVTATAGLVIAITHFNTPLSEVEFSHGRLGVAVMALCYSQVIMGFKKPAGEGPTTCRKCWEMLHPSISRLAGSLGIVNMILGAFIISTEFHDPFGLWVGLAAGSLAFFSVLFTIMDKMEQNTVRSIVRAALKDKSKRPSTETARFDPRHSSSQEYAFGVVVQREDLQTPHLSPKETPPGRRPRVDGSVGGGVPNGYHRHAGPGYSEPSWSTANPVPRTLKPPEADDVPPLISRRQGGPTQLSSNTYPFFSKNPHFNEGASSEYRPGPLDLTALPKLSSPSSVLSPSPNMWPMASSSQTSSFSPDSDLPSSQILRSTQNTSGRMATKPITINNGYPLGPSVLPEAPVVVQTNNRGLVSLKDFLPHSNSNTSSHPSDQEPGSPRKEDSPPPAEVPSEITPSSPPQKSSSGAPSLVRRSPSFSNQSCIKGSHNKPIKVDVAQPGGRHVRSGEGLVSGKGKQQQKALRGGPSPKGSPQKKPGGPSPKGSPHKKPEGSSPKESPHKKPGSPPSVSTTSSGDYNKAPRDVREGPNQKKSAFIQAAVKKLFPEVETITGEDSPGLGRLRSPLEPQPGAKEGPRSSHDPPLPLNSRKSSGQAFDKKKKLLYGSISMPSARGPHTPATPRGARSPPA